MAYLTDEQKYFYAEQGYLILKNALDPETIAAMRGAVDEIVAGKDDGIRRKLTLTRQDSTRATQFHKVFPASPVIWDFIHTAPLSEIASELMSTTEVRLFYDQLIYKEPEVGGPIPTHQDYAYWTHVSSTNIVTAWTALSTSSPETGCVYVVPGSHKWGLVECLTFRILDPDPEYLINNCLSEEQKAQILRVPLALEPGDVSFHHCLTIHGSYPNTSSNVRVGYIQHYLPGEARYLEARDIQKHHEIDVPDGEQIRGEQFPLLYRAAELQNA